MSVTALKSGLKTPITYYGGKQSMVNDILPLIPPHRVYVEPFFGGGAIFWAKQPSATEIVNDYNSNVTNFYDVLKHNFLDLRKLVESTMHSRGTYKRALVIYEEPELFTDFPIHRAWAFYTCTNQGFASKIGTWGYDSDKRSVTVQNKIDRFKEELSERMKYVQVERNDASKVILSRDGIDSFHYVDPPYIDSNQGHYGGYTEAHFKVLLNTLSTIKGKFLLSSYESEILSEYTQANGWFTIKKEKVLSASNGKVIKKRKKKIEVLTANYEIK